MIVKQISISMCNCSIHSIQNFDSILTVFSNFISCTYIKHYKASELSQWCRKGKFLGVPIPICQQRTPPSKTKFANKEGFPLIPTLASTNGVLQICQQAKYLLPIYQQAKCLGDSAPPTPPYDYVPELSLQNLTISPYKQLFMKTEEIVSRKLKTKKSNFV